LPSSGAWRMGRWAGSRVGIFSGRADCGNWRNSADSLLRAPDSNGRSCAQCTPGLPVAVGRRLWQVPHSAGMSSNFTTRPSRACNVTRFCSL
jgi:hypothetical protein